MSNILVKNTLIYAVGNLGSRLLSFLIVPLYSFYLTKSELGQYDLLLSSVSIFVPFITLQIADSVYRWLIEAKDNIGLQKQAITVGSFVVLMNIVFAFSIYFLLRDKFRIEYIHFFIAILFLNISYSYLQQVCRGIQKNKLYSESGILFSLVYVVANIVIIVFYNINVKILFTSTILAYLITIIYMLIKTRYIYYIDFKNLSFQIARRMINYSLPLIPNTVSWFLINEANKFIILSKLSISDNGIYAIANKFPTILTILTSVFVLAWQDKSFIEEINERVKINNTIIYENYINIVFGLAIILISISKLILHYSVGSEFYEAWKYMPMLYVAVGFSSLANFLGTFYLKSKLTKGLFLAAIVGGAINILSTYLLINEIGLYAPVYGTLIGFVVVWLIRTMHTKKHIDSTKIILRIIVLTLICIGNNYVMYYENKVINIVTIICSLLISVLINKKVIVKLASSLNIFQHFKIRKQS